MAHHFHPIQVQNTAFLLATIPAWLVVALIVGAVRERNRRGVPHVAPHRSAAATRARILGSTSLL